MARKKRVGVGGFGSGSWIGTYANMATLLLALFILLFSMSSLDSVRFNMFVKAAKETFSSNSAQHSKIVLADAPEGDEQLVLPPADVLEPAVVRVPMQELFDTLTKQIENQGLGDSVKVSMGGDYLFIRFTDDLLFEPDSAVLKQDDREILQFVGNGVKSIQSDINAIAVHGHFVSNSGDAANNWALSGERADAIVVFFDGVIGINAQKMQAVAWGGSKPIVLDDTEQGRAANRRIEIFISMKNLLAEQLDNAYGKLVE